ncbi:MAG TPA: peptidoglycan DD-metalloendopeptidase family protein [Prolixibacteraceae bacterium]|nr:peptidoglycan DD-metalloendopeptidase family protein [Prolixibacteraceae bacterium]
MKISSSRKMRRLIRVLIGVVAFAAALQVAFYIFDFYENKQIEKEIAAETEVVIPEPVMLFNLPIDSIKVIPGNVQSGQNLSEILLAKGISMGRIDEIAKKSVPTFDVRSMKVNNPYYFFMNKMDSTKVDYFIYEIDPIDYVVYQLTDSIRIYKEKKPIITLIKTASGVITSSLWNAMTAQALRPELAMELSDIYQWTIDFYGIQKGDKFKLVYEENFVFGKSIGIGRIFAAQFVHANEDFYAFRYTQNNEDSYFDQLGKSLKTAFLKAPLKFSRISSKFTNHRFHPVLKIFRAHHGVDYAAASGTPVVSIGDGTIIAKGYQAAGGGNYLKIKHNATYTTSYMHLKGFAKGISHGVHVKQGQLIGYVGSTGLATGPHLDYRVFKNGTAIDPLKMKSPPTIPISKENIKSYEMHCDSLMTKLTAIKNF